ncbi:hypothetical protein AAIH55_36775, partial [Pseudomonas aeruginosa]
VLWVVVVTTSGEWDHALRAAFLRAPNRRYPVYWAARGALGSGASELAIHRSAKAIQSQARTSFSKHFNSEWKRLIKASARIR